MLYTILLSCHTVRGAWGKLQPCEVETGQTNIIMDMEESRGNCEYIGPLIIIEPPLQHIILSFIHTAISQRTNPPDLPIYGDPNTEIALELVFPKGNPMFILNEKKLQLLQPLDRDEENLSHIVFQVRIRSENALYLGQGFMDLFAELTNCITTRLSPSRFRVRFGRRERNATFRSLSASQTSTTTRQSSSTHRTRLKYLR